MDLLIFGLLVLGLPALGILIDMVVMNKLLVPAMDKKRPDHKNWDEEKTRIKSRIMIMKSMSYVGLAFGLLIFIFAAISEAEFAPKVEQRILLSAGLAVGLSSLFMCIGMALMYREAVPKVVDDPTLFGKYLILTSIPMTSAVYGLTLSILLFLGVGILQPVELVLSQSDADYLFYAYLIFSGLSIFTILKGYLPTRYKKSMKTIDIGRIRAARCRGRQPAPQPDRVFSKKMIIGVIPEIFPVVGFAVILVALMNKGVL